MSMYIHIKLNSSTEPYIQKRMATGKKYLEQDRVNNWCDEVSKVHV